MPMTAMVLGEPRRGINPLKDGHLRAMTMLPTPLQLCRMAPGQQLHSDPLKSSPWTPPCGLLVEEVPKMPNGTLAPEPVTLAYVASTPTPMICTTSELYDSGAMRHMTPYGDALVNYATIAPIPINTTN